MARRRKGNWVDGWVVVDKPAGMGSTQVVSKVRWLFQAQKAGHGGTLDPLATGLLPIALGEATKTVPYVMDGRKSYTFAIVWGEERTTDDAEGEVCATSDYRPTAEEIEQALPAFRGTIQQVPPQYSALKVDGERAYDLARSGETVALAARPIDIYAFELLSCGEDHACFRVDSGKGAYMRSLARDLARAVGTVGYIRDLRRVRCGAFAIEHAISLDKLSELGHSAEQAQALWPVATALDDIPALALTAAEACKVAHGHSIPLSAGHCWPEGQVLRLMDNDRVAALAHLQDGVLRLARVLNPPPETSGGCSDNDR